MNTPLISICIPAYKRPDYIKRLLDSIAIQTFRGFEVIVTDDSPDEGVRRICLQELWPFPLAYYRNSPALGTPENWNEAIRRATGDWIKLMHDDDWFAGEESLSHFVDALAAAPETRFFFSAYRNVSMNNTRTEEVFIPLVKYQALLRNPANLFSKNVIGPPSVIMHKGSPALFYDHNLKWLVDIEFYIRALKESRPVYIDQVLVNVGLSDQQVTRESFRRRTVEIPENFYVLNKLGLSALKNLRIYDAWWRLIRNLEIRHVSAIPEAGYGGNIPSVILSMLAWQGKMPLFLLKNGFFSKIFMFLNYIFNFNKIEK